MPGPRPRPSRSRSTTERSRCGSLRVVVHAAGVHVGCLRGSLLVVPSLDCGRPQSRKRLEMGVLPFARFGRRRRERPRRSTRSSPRRSSSGSISTLKVCGSTCARCTSRSREIGPSAAWRASRQRRSAGFRPAASKPSAACSASTSARSITSRSRPAAVQSSASSTRSASRGVPRESRAMHRAASGVSVTPIAALRTVTSSASAASPGRSSSRMRWNRVRSGSGSRCGSVVAASRVKRGKVRVTARSRAPWWSVRKSRPSSSAG